MKILDLCQPIIGEIVEFVTPYNKVYGCVIESTNDSLVFEMLPESSGYIAKNAKEAQDPRWSTSLTVDVDTDTMRKQLSAFFPTTAPSDGQEQIKEATYKGKEVSLGKPYHYKGSKKFYLYIKDPDSGKIIKVKFGRASHTKIKRVATKSTKHKKRK